jgi:hypothetical protein
MDRIRADRFDPGNPGHHRSQVTAIARMDEALERAARLPANTALEEDSHRPQEFRGDQRQRIAAEERPLRLSRSLLGTNWASVCRFTLLASRAVAPGLHR